ncbi:MAG: hypothetical protein J0M26_08270 [Planctomycetes bacterium]|nr:hypothetical protein [Planctomycetota bacterium]
MKLKELQGYIQSAAAFRCVAELQPAGGPGDKEEVDCEKTRFILLAMRIR